MLEAFQGWGVLGSLLQVLFMFPVSISVITWPYSNSQNQVSSICWNEQRKKSCGIFCSLKPALLPAAVAWTGELRGHLGPGTAPAKSNFLPVPQRSTAGYKGRVRNIEAVSNKTERLVKTQDGKKKIKTSV